MNIETSDNRTKTLIFADDVQINTNDTFTIVLHDENGELLSNKDITFIIENKTYSTKTNSEEKPSLRSIPLQECTTLM